MKRFITIAAVAVLGIGLVALSTSYAQGNKSRGGYGHRGGGGEGHVPFQALKEHAKEIGITDEQMTKLQSLYLNHEKEVIQLKADKKIVELDLRMEMDKTAPDKKAVGALIDRINDLEGKVRKARTMHLIDAKSLLTPEQLAKISELRQERRGDMRGRGMQQRGDRMNDRMRMRMHNRPDFDDDQNPPPPPPADDEEPDSDTM